MSDSPGFLILAAGQGSRFGGNKLTAMLDGKAIIQHCIDKLIPLSFPIAIVYDPNNILLYQCLSPYNIEKIPAKNATAGMGYNLAYGVEQTKHWQGWVICLGDMPWVLPETYKNTANAIATHAIVRPTVVTKHNPQKQSDKYQSQGHPVGFHAQFRSELQSLTGDQGAKNIISQHKSCLYCFETSDYGILLDIDRPSDLNRPP